jgi:8-oxo-dGTP pyrophosphatase MutT (NUDIX family)
MAKYLQRVRIIPICKEHPSNFYIGYGKMIPSESVCYWQLAGGKVESGETIIDAAYRELKEEFGISPNPESDPYPWTAILTGTSFKTEYNLKCDPSKLSKEQLRRRKEYCGVETHVVSLFIDRNAFIAATREVTEVATVNIQVFELLTIKNPEAMQSEHREAFTSMYREVLRVMGADGQPSFISLET